MGLHRIVVLDGDAVFARHLVRGGGKGLLRIAARRRRRCDAGTLLGRHIGRVAHRCHIRGMRRLVVAHLHQRGGVAGSGEILRHHQRHGLAAVMDLGIVEGAEGRARRRHLVLVVLAAPGGAGPVLMGEDLYYAGHGQRRCGVDCGDLPAGDAAGHHDAVQQAGGGELGGIFRCAGHLGLAIHAALRGAEIGGVAAHRTGPLTGSACRRRSAACRRPPGTGRAGWPAAPWGS